MNKKIAIIPISILSLFATSHINLNNNQIETAKQVDVNTLDSSAPWDNSIQLEYINDYSNVNITNTNSLLIDTKKE